MTMKQPYRRRRQSFLHGGHARLALLVLAAAVACPNIVSAQNTKPPDAAPPMSIRERQAAVWAAYYAGRHAEAAKLAEPLLKAPERKDQIQATHAIARCLWAQGDSRSQAQARQLWGQLDKMDLPLAKTQAQIGAALVAAGGKDDGSKA